MYLKLNQEEFGKILGISKSGVSDIESGRRNVTEQHIIMLKSIDVNEEWLRTGQGKMFIERNKEQELITWASTALSGQSSSFRKRFVTMLMSLSEKDWEFLEAKANMLFQEDTLHDEAPKSAMDLEMKYSVDDGSSDDAV